MEAWHSSSSSSLSQVASSSWLVGGPPMAIHVQGKLVPACLKVGHLVNRGQRAESHYAEKLRPISSQGADTHKAHC